MLGAYSANNGKRGTPALTGNIAIGTS